MGGDAASGLSCGGQGRGRAPGLCGDGRVPFHIRASRGPETQEPVFLGALSRWVGSGRVGGPAGGSSHPEAETRDVHSGARCPPGAEQSPPGRPHCPRGPRRLWEFGAPQAHEQQGWVQAASQEFLPNRLGDILVGRCVPWACPATWGRGGVRSAGVGASPRHLAQRGQWASHHLPAQRSDRPTVTRGGLL